MQNKSGEFHQCPQRYDFQGNPEYLEQLLLKQAAQAQTDRDNASKLIALYNELGAFYRGTCRYAQSLHAFEQAKALAAGPEGDCCEYAAVLNNMAGTCRLMKDYEGAVNLFTEALELYREKGRQKSEAYASVLNNLSLTYREMKQNGRAIEYLSQALELLEDMPGRRQEIAVLYSNLTALYHETGDEEQAERCLNCALQEYEKCPQEERIHYAAVLGSLAGFLCTKGKYERALLLYRKSAKYTKCFSGENEEYGAILQTMRWVYEKMGRRKEAAAVLEQAQKVFERIFGADHERTQAVADDLKRLKEEGNA